MGGLILAFALGAFAGSILGWLVVTPKVDGGTGLSWFTDPGLALAALRQRLHLPVLQLDVDFEALQRLSAPSGGGADAGGLDSERCVEAAASVGKAPTDVQLCPLSADAGLAPGARSLNRRPAQGLAMADLLLVAKDAPVLGVELGRVTSVNAESIFIKLYFDELRSMGVPAPTYEVVRLAVNGTGWGTVAVEGPPSAAMVNAAGLDPGSVVVAPAAAPGRVAADGGHVEAQDAIALTAAPPYASSTVLEGEDRAASEQGRRTSEEAIALIKALAGRAVSPSEVLDPAVWGRFLSLTALWRGVLSPDWGALTYAYEPATQSLIPVGTAEALEDGGSVLADLMRDPIMQRAYVSTLAAFSGPTIVDDGDTDMAELEARYLALGVAPNAPATLRDVLEINRARMQALIQSPHPLDIQMEDAAGAVTLRVVARLPLCVEVVALDFGARGTIQLDSAWVDGGLGKIDGIDGIVIPPAGGGSPATVSLRIPASEIPGTGQIERGELRVVTRILGQTAQVSVPVTSERGQAWWTLEP
ncbi:MAG: hypothetical protein ACP5HG_08395 [Anaerolineae bacterium]